MVFVCNLQNTHSFPNVVILFAIKTCQPCHYIKPMTRNYTRERHENKNTRFWATYGLKRSEKRQERVLHRPMQKFNKFTEVFRIFLVLQICFIS